MDIIYDDCYNKPPGCSCASCIAYGFCITNKRKGVPYDENIHLLSTTEKYPGATYEDIIRYYMDEHSCLKNHLNSQEVKSMVSFIEEYEKKFCN